MDADLAEVRAGLERDSADLDEARNGLERDEAALREVRSQLPGAAATAGTTRSDADTARGHAEDAALVHEDARESHDRAAQGLADIDTEIDNALGRRDDAAARRAAAQTELPGVTGPVLAAGPSALPTSRTTLASTSPRWPGSGLPRTAGPSTGNTPGADDTSTSDDDTDTTTPDDDSTDDTHSVPDTELTTPDPTAPVPPKDPATGDDDTTDDDTTGGDQDDQGSVPHQDSVFDALVGKTDTKGKAKAPAEDDTNGTSTDPTSPNSATPNPTSPAPAVPQHTPFQIRPPRGRTIRTRGDGRCLLYTFLGTDPQRIRDQVPNLRTEAPATYAWLGRPDQVRAGMAQFAQWNGVSGPIPPRATTCGSRPTCSAPTPRTACSPPAADARCRTRWSARYGRPSRRGSTRARRP